jgi:hypothetical protein
MKTKVEGLELEGSVSEFVELVLALKGKSKVKPEPVDDSVLKTADEWAEEEFGVKSKPVFRRSKAKSVSKPVIALPKFNGSKRRKARFEMLYRVMVNAHSKGISYGASAKDLGVCALNGTYYKILKRLAYRFGFKPTNLERVRVKSGVKPVVKVGDGRGFFDG